MCVLGLTKALDFTVDANECSGSREREKRTYSSCKPRRFRRRRYCSCSKALQQRENPSGGSTPASSPVGDREEEVVEDDNSDDDDFDENDVEINGEITEALADDTETETVDGCDPGGRFRAETSEGILEVTTAAAATTSRKFPPPGRGSAKKRRGSGLSSPSRYLMSPFAGRQRMRGRSTGIGRASPAGEHEGRGNGGEKKKELSLFCFRRFSHSLLIFFRHSRLRPPQLPPPLSLLRTRFCLALPFLPFS